MRRWIASRTISPAVNLRSYEADVSVEASLQSIFIQVAPFHSTSRQDLTRSLPRDNMTHRLLAVEIFKI